MRYLILIILFLMAQLGWKPPQYPRPTPTPVPTVIPTSVPAQTVHAVWVTSSPNSNYTGYMCQYPPDTKWYRCYRYVYISNGKSVTGFTPKPGSG